MLISNTNLNDFSSAVSQQDFINMLDLNLKDKLEENLCLANLLGYEYEFKIMTRLRDYDASFGFMLGNYVLYLSFLISRSGSKFLEQVRFSYGDKYADEEFVKIYSNKNNLIDQIETIEKFKTFL